MSEYRWSARRQCTKPFLSNRNGIQLALHDQLELKLTAKTRNEINGVLEKFKCANVSSFA